MRLIILFAVASAWISRADAQGDLQYDRNQVIKEQVLSEAMATAEACMVEAEQSKLMGGERNSEAIINFATNLCVNSFNVVIARGWVSQDAAYRATLAMAREELLSIPGVTKQP